jgi:hypothetical protein
LIAARIMRRGSSRLVRGLPMPHEKHVIRGFNGIRPFPNTKSSPSMFMCVLKKLRFITCFGSESRKWYDKANAGKFRNPVSPSVVILKNLSPSNARSAHVVRCPNMAHPRQYCAN